MHHPEVDAIPLPGNTHRACFGAGHARGPDEPIDRHGRAQGLQAASMVEVLVTDDDRVHGANAAGTQPGQQRVICRRAAVAPARARVVDEYVPRRANNGRKALAHVQQRQLESSRRERRRGSQQQRRQADRPGDTQLGTG